MGSQGTGGALGEVAERLNAAVLKTAVGLAPTVGSNPTLSVYNQEVKSKIVCGDSASIIASIRTKTHSFEAKTAYRMMLTRSQHSEYRSGNTSASRKIAS